MLVFIIFLTVIVVGIIILTILLFNQHPKEINNVSGSKYHFLVSAQCKPYQDWQCIAVDWSIRKRWPAANCTRLLSCNKKYNYPNIVPTYPVSDWSVHPDTGDSYLPYNRPAAIKEYFENVIPAEEYMIIVDPDVIVRKPMNDIQVSLGKPVAQKYDYLLRNDALSKIGKEILGSDRGLQPIGMPMIIHRDDLGKLAPLWLKYTEEIRNNPKTKELAGWIAEMHSYCLAAAKLGLKHTVRNDLADRTPYDRVKDPYTLHYDIVHEYKDFKWDKRDHHETDFIKNNDTIPVPTEYPNHKFKQVFDDLNTSIKDKRAA